MKHLLTTSLGSLLLLWFTGAGAQESVTSKAAGSTMKGAYNMTLQKANIDGRDSAFNTSQLKIYTDRHYMWAHALPNDSLGEFGIGTYRVQNGKVVEYPVYSTIAGQVGDTFELDIEKRGDGYSQVINLPPDTLGRTWILTEEYREVGTNATTPLDGAWKMTGATEYPKGGTPRQIPNPVQYKVYQSGYVMWANSYKDSATQKPVSAFGYGTFKMSGANKAIETMTNTTYRTDLVGNPVTLQLQFKGKDGYQQTIVWPDGARTVEVYERLKE